MSAATKKTVFLILITNPFLKCVRNEMGTPFYIKVRNANFVDKNLSMTNSQHNWRESYLLTMLNESTKFQVSYHLTFPSFTRKQFAKSSRNGNCGMRMRMSGPTLK